MTQHLIASKEHAVVPVTGGYEFVAGAYHGPVHRHDGTPASKRAAFAAATVDWQAWADRKPQLSAAKDEQQQSNDRQDHQHRP